MFEVRKSLAVATLGVGALMGAMPASASACAAAASQNLVYPQILKEDLKCLDESYRKIAFGGSALPGDLSPDSYGQSRGRLQERVYAYERTNLPSSDGRTIQIDIENLTNLLNRFAEFPEARKKLG